MTRVWYGLMLIGLGVAHHGYDPADDLTVVFVSRRPVQTADVGAVPGIGPRYRTAVTGGMLLKKGPRGALDTLVGPDRLVDVSDLCVSWDAQRLLFSGVAHPDSAWRIYEMQMDGTHFHPVTRSDRTIALDRFGQAAVLFARYDDFDPCYMPDGRIVFASTRYPSLAVYDSVRTSNLFVMNADGSDLRRITTERSGGEEPSIDPATGRIIYARWWINIDLPTNQTKIGITHDQNQALTNDMANVWEAVTIEPDGSDLKLYSGFPRIRSSLHSYKPVITDQGNLLAVFTEHPGMAPTVGALGIRWFRKGVSPAHPVAGYRVDLSAEPPFAVDPVPLTDSTVLFSYAPDGKDYDIYSASLDGANLKKVCGIEGRLELDAQVVRPRKIPPVIADRFSAPVKEVPPTEDPGTFYENGSFRFDCMNIFANGGIDEMIPDAPRVRSHLTMRFFINPQRGEAAAAPPSILFRESQVELTGGVHVTDIPADVPLFEQVIDDGGNVLETTSGRFAHVTGFNFEHKGSGTKCVGCHTGHTLLTVPANATVAEWFNAAPSAQVTGSAYWTDETGHRYLPARVVDRQARIGGDSVIWVCPDRKHASVRLIWETPLEFTAVALYNILPDKRTNTSVQVEDCEVILLHQGMQVRTLPKTGKLSTDGTTLTFDPTVADEIVVRIKRAKGKFKGFWATGLAEVEVTARIVKPE